MTFRADVNAIAQHNARTLRAAPLAELSGALGDLGTLLPLMVAMTLKGSINLGSTLVFSGLANILTGVFFGIPLPVQPMKAIAAVAISLGFDKQETAAAGLTMGIAVFVLSATGLLKWLHRVVPVSVVKGIQVGAGLSLVISAGSSLVKPLDWASPAWDNRIWAIAAFLGLVGASIYRRIPYALIVFAIGLVIAAAVPGGSKGFSAGLWRPSLLFPSGKAWKTGAIDAAIPQLPLTTLNSILAVASLAGSLFPTFPPTPSTTSIGFSVAIANLIGCWFGAMPVCHGSGGLAGQYRFGARSGSSIIILGSVKLILGIFVGEAIIPLLNRFPHGLLGIMVLAAGVELSKVGQSVGETRDLWEQEDNEQIGEQERNDRWMVMLITIAGCLAFKNDAVGFFAGLVWHWGLRLPAHVRGRRSVQLGHGEDNGSLR
ncbi:hypothetical protein AC579_1719 [Pseudocercospora musae]|uniref:Sulfate transporter n=1 Tax=Pseudocercospora musae TaxID=113226 RepID=A0A139ICB5_9PEZI|nr:hypothetical protein AC579_1719 [Pseudocercospora musae]